MTMLITLEKSGQFKKVDKILKLAAIGTGIWISPNGKSFIAGDWHGDFLANNAEELNQWLKTAVRFPVEQNYLNNYLSSPDPFPYTHQLEEYFESRGIQPENFDPEEAHAWFETATPEQYDDFTKWLYDENNLDQAMDYFGAPQSSLRIEKKITTPIWMIHLTNDADRIEDKGFEYGHPDYDGIHLTTWKSDKSRKSTPGYNFAFPLRSRDADAALRQRKYGSEAVIFKGTGIQVYHSGDEEQQIIFWGPSVDPASIYHVKKIDDGWLEDYNINPEFIKNEPEFAVFDANDRLQFFAETPAEIAAWIDRAGDQILRNVHQKRQNQRRERQRRSAGRQKFTKLAWGDGGNRSWILPTGATINIPIYHQTYVWDLLQSLWAGERIPDELDDPDILKPLEYLADKTQDDMYSEASERASEYKKTLEEQLEWVREDPDRADEIPALEEEIRKIEEGRLDSEFEEAPSGIELVDWLLNMGWIRKLEQYSTLHYEYGRVDEGQLRRIFKQIENDLFDVINPRNVEYLKARIENYQSGFYQEFYLKDFINSGETLSEFIQDLPSAFMHGR